MKRIIERTYINVRTDLFADNSVRICESDAREADYPDYGAADVGAVESRPGSTGGPGE